MIFCYILVLATETMSLSDKVNVWWLWWFRYTKLIFALTSTLLSFEKHDCLFPLRDRQQGHVQYLKRSEVF